MIAAWAVATALAAWSPGTGHGPLRIALVVGLIAVGALIIRVDRRWLISPLFALGAIPVVFYAIGPWIAFQLFPEGPPFSGPLDAASEFLSGQGELLVLQFSALCLAAVAALAGPRTTHDQRGERDALRKAGLFCIVLLLAVAAALFVARFNETIAAFAGAGAGRQIYDAMPVLMSFAIAVVAAAAALVGGGWRVAALLVGAVALGTAFATGFVKPAVFASGAALLLFAVLARLRAASAILMAGGIAMLLVTAALVVTFARNPQIHSTDFIFTPRGADFLRHALFAKLFARQVATGGCLQRVTDAHLPGDTAESPFYFLIAPVPRVLWPNKPNLSLGAEYGRRYCGTPPHIEGNPVHSASITLLGQPIVQAGATGLAVAQGLTIAALVGLTMICLRRGTVGLIALATLFPWLADFDQSFALYVANGTKFALISLPALAALAWLMRGTGFSGADPAAK